MWKGTFKHKFLSNSLIKRGPPTQTTAILIGLGLGGWLYDCQTLSASHPGIQQNTISNDPVVLSFPIFHTSSFQQRRFFRSSDIGGDVFR